MPTPRRISGVAAATAAAVLAAGAGTASAHQLRAHEFFNDSQGAVFVQTDNQAGNTIVAYDREADGTLVQAGTYATGGLGGQQTGSQVDHLASQGSLQYDAAAGELFAVNAGSDSVSVFAVDGDHLQLKQVVPSGGSFPSSITVNGDLVYVLNAFGSGAIQGYRLIDGYLAAIPGSNRSLGLTPVTGATQFVNTPGQVAFTPDGRDLIVTTKANGSDIDVFSVNAFGQPSAAPAVNAEGGNVPFAIAFEGQNQVVIGEAGNDSVDSFALSPSGTLTPESTLLTGGAATCWLVADGPELFAGNAGSATESSVLAGPFGSLTLTDTTGTDPGTVDAATSPDGRYLYVQTGGKGIVDEFQVGFLGTLHEVGSVTVPDAVGGQGIATS